METTKILGIILLIVGLLLIILPLWQTYSIFTGKAMPAQVFKKPVVLQMNQNVSALDIQGQIQNALIKVIPIDFIDNTLNLITWLILVWILMYGGGQIAGIGVKLLNGRKQ